MYRFWFFLTVCIYGILAFHIKDEFEYLNNWMYNDDTASKNKNEGEKDRECKRDLLIMVDVSNSVGEHHLKVNVKPFLKKLVKSPKLKVGGNGTHVGLMQFATNVKLLLNVGQGKNVSHVESKIESLHLEEDVGEKHFTRTDLAFNTTNTKVFPLDNPLNANRADIQDVTLLITDGQPRKESDPKGENTDTKRDTTTQANILKKKNISLVILGVGKLRDEFKGYMQNLATSSDYYFDAKFSDMEDVLAKIVKKSCAPSGKHPCNCDKIGSIIKIIEPGKSTVKVDLPSFPPLNCEGDAKVIKEKTEVKPQLPREFPAGVHIVNRTFFLENSRVPKLTCSMTFKVRGPCTCKEIAPITRTIPPGKSTVELNLPTQSPICENGAEVKGRADIIPQIPRELPVGSYEFTYVFTLKKAKDKKITCPIKVQVKEFEGTCSCDKNGKTITRNISSESSAAKVTLKPPPITCTHDAKVIGGTVAAPATNRFPAGKHTVNFKAFLGKAKDYSIICPQIIEVKVLCNGVPYDPKEKLCCCGKIHQKKTGYKCCGINYYNPNAMKCCGNSNLYSFQESC